MINRHTRATMRHDIKHSSRTKLAAFAQAVGSRFTATADSACGCYFYRLRVGPDAAYVNVVSESDAVEAIHAYFGGHPNFAEALSAFQEAR